MAKKPKEPDQLTIESTAALAAGMSYGKWKAAQNPVKVVMPAEIEKARRKMTRCVCCGKEILQSRNGGRKYCDEYCAAEYRRRSGKWRKPKETEKEGRA